MRADFDKIIGPVCNVPIILLPALIIPLRFRSNGSYSMGASGA